MIFYITDREPSSYKMFFLKTHKKVFAIYFFKIYCKTLTCLLATLTSMIASKRATKFKT